MGLFSLFLPKTKRRQRRADNKDATIDTYDTYLNQEFFKEVVDHLDSMMLYFFQGQGWIGANQTFFDTLKFSDMQDFLAKHESVRDLFRSESEEIFSESDKSWLDYIRKHHRDGYRVTLLDKNSKLFQMDAKCHTFEKNKNFYVLELKDMTDLYHATSQIEEMEELKSKFLGNIGHEFRTPLHGILGFVELMEHTNLEKKQAEYLNLIHTSSNNLMTRIEKLIDLSQLREGKLRLFPKAFNLLPEMEIIASDFSLLAREKDIQFLTFIDPKLPQEIFGDAKKISQILFSLVQNAIKYTPRGGEVIVEIKLLKREKNGDCSIWFGVRDNGKGMPQEQIAHINEPFRSELQAEESVGIGLALSNGLVNLLGSQFHIQSNEGEGTYINFVLDFQASQGQNYQMVPKRKVKILLLDKNGVEEANFLATYLRSFALDVVKSNQLDANLYDGIEALYIVANQEVSSWRVKLESYTKRVPIILLLDRNEQLETKLRPIVDEVIRKPLLPSTIAKHLYQIKTEERKPQPVIDKLDFIPTINALVVEDNSINQKLIQIILQGYKINVTTAINGVEAVHLCSKTKYDIIFMDIDMPEKNGIEATKEIKESMELNRVTPIVALTAMAMDGDKEMLIENGLDDYLSKPLSQDKLANILDKYLTI